MDSADPTILWDRSRFISEYVYNPILKARPIAYTWQEWQRMLTMYLSRPQLFIYCSRGLDKIREGFNERDQLDGVAHNIERLHNAYSRIVSWIDFNFTLTHPDESRVVVWDFDKNDNFDYIRVAIDLYLEVVDERTGLS